MTARLAIGLLSALVLAGALASHYGGYYALALLLAFLAGAFAVESDYTT